MGRRVVVLACVRTVLTFTLGFGLGVVIHLFVNLSTNLSHSNVPRNYKGNRRLEEQAPYEARVDLLIGERTYSPSQPPANEGWLSAGGGGGSGGGGVLCYVLTGPTNHRSALHVKNTWGQRCDKVVFYSTKQDEALQPEVLDVPEGYGYLWAKTKAALTHLYHHHPHYQWYMKADDDTFVIVENLRYFLRDLDPDLPLYYGAKFKMHVKQGYMSGGGGYVLSREAVKKFVTEALQLTDQAKCPTNTSRGSEDVQLGLCLESVGVAAGDSLDRAGKSRFFSNSPLSLFYHQPLVNKLHWYWRYLWHKHGVGPDCCSRHLISFHDVSPRMMWTLEALLYRLHIHRDLQPPHLNTSTSPAPPPDSSTPPPRAPPAIFSLRT
ncbi:glycoprotein-N-acetylgalactosamine 3-beta-galactosyltransferase 1-like isoform X2 [Homarus americanus]|nr:glycoprotein-N-acetylgalactosamine 3-beta-galactosyltransferase 1-like isoform X2 [Homarus americanus]